MKIAPDISDACSRLQAAMAAGRTLPYCLRLWGEFIRLRDGNQCVICHETKELFAHHIARKCIFIPGRLETGNGITLCRGCHNECHEGFNGIPDLQLPMDAQNGEKIELLAEAYGLLLTDARERGILCDDFYFVGDQMLTSFKKLQGFEPTPPFPGCRLEQAFLIWRQTPRDVLRALMSANGFDIPENFIQLGPDYSFWIPEE